MKHILMTLSIIGLLAGTSFDADAHRGRGKAKGHHKACCKKSKSCCKSSKGCHKGVAKAHR